MKDTCSHGVEWGFLGRCSTCIELEISEEIPSIDRLCRAYQSLREAYNHPSRLARGIAPREGDEESDFLLAVAVWQNRTREMCEPAEAYELGGES